MFDEFILFLKNNNIAATIVATVLSSYITELTSSFTDDLILPVLNLDLDGDGKSDIKSIKKIKIQYKGMVINIGNFILTFIKVSIIFIVLFYINKLAKSK